jgi:single-strand DNA-binding protein
MASVNKTILVGNVTRDPEIRYLPSGQAVANIGLATSTRRKDKVSGETIETTEFHRVTFYDKLAEIVGEYVKKGKPLYIEGRLKYGKFTNKDGHEQNTCDIIATEMQLLGGRDSGSAPSAPPAQNNAPQSRPAAPKPATGSGFDDMLDDIPF